MSDFVFRLLGFPQLNDELHSAAREITASILALHPRSPNPHLVHTAGIPGSGKTTDLLEYEVQARQRGKDCALLTFDGVMVGLPGYQQHAAENPLDAFKKYETPGRMVTYHVLDTLLDAGVNILFEHGGSNPSHLHLLRYARQIKGYHTEMRFLDCPLAIAQQRVRDRNALGGRFLPEEFLMPRQAILKALLPHYRSVVNEFTTIDSHLAAQRPRPVFESARYTR